MKLDIFSRIIKSNIEMQLSCGKINFTTDYFRFYLLFHLITFLNAFMKIDLPLKIASLYRVSGLIFLAKEWSTFKYFGQRTKK